MCCDLLFVILVCKHVGEMVREKGRDPLLYQILMAFGWVGGEVVGGVVGAVLAAILSDGNEDAVGLGAGIGVLLGLACGAGPAYLLAANVTRDPNYRPPMPAPGTSPYGNSPYGAPPNALGVPLNSTNPYAAPSVSNPFADGQTSYPANPPAYSAPSANPPAAAAPGIPSFLPASAFAPANPGPKRVQFYCPAGHILEEWSTSAGQQRRCPHCGGVATVPVG